MIQGISEIWSNAGLFLDILAAALTSAYIFGLVVSGRQKISNSGHILGVQEKLSLVG